MLCWCGTMQGHSLGAVQMSVQCLVWDPPQGLMVSFSTLTPWQEVYVCIFMPQQARRSNDGPSQKNTMRDWAWQCCCFRCV